MKDYTLSKEQIAEPESYLEEHILPDAKSAITYIHKQYRINGVKCALNKPYLTSVLRHEVREIAGLPFPILL
jgi:hypothetical protein